MRIPFRNGKRDNAKSGKDLSSLGEGNESLGASPDGKPVADDLLRAEFEEAAARLESSAGADQMSQEDLLMLYGLYKQATSGPCTTFRPPFFDLKARSKWYGILAHHIALNDQRCSLPTVIAFTSSRIAPSCYIHWSRARLLSLTRNMCNATLKVAFTWWKQSHHTNLEVRKDSILKERLESRMKSPCRAAWKNLEDMPQEQAKVIYTEAVRKILPMEGNGRVGGMRPVISRMADEATNSDDDVPVNYLPLASPRFEAILFNAN